MEELPAGLLRVTMPMPMRPGHVHCYLLPGEDGYTLVDTGLGLPDAADLWRAELSQLEAPVARLLITHFHPDHEGCSREIQELTGAPVLRGALDLAQSRLAWGNEGWPRVLDEWFRANGVPAAVTEELVTQGSIYGALVHTVPEPEIVADGDRLDGWEVVAAPGHADGQLTLLRDGVLIAADHLLDRITPTVGLWPASRLDPLGDYLAALRRTIELAPRVAYGGHGRVIEDPVGRAHELIAHHHERLAVVEAALGAEPSTGYDVSFPLFGEDLHAVARRFAVAETLSHLERLVREERAERLETSTGGDVVSVSYTAAQ